MSGEGRLAPPAGRVLKNTCVLGMRPWVRRHPGHRLGSLVIRFSSGSLERLANLPRIANKFEADLHLFGILAFPEDVWAVFFDAASAELAFRGDGVIRSLVMDLGGV